MSELFNQINLDLKKLLRPYKWGLLRTLVLGKKALIHLIFRFSRFYTSLRILVSSKTASSPNPFKARIRFNNFMKSHVPNWQINLYILLFSPKINISFIGPIDPGKSAELSQLATKLKSPVQANNLSVQEALVEHFKTTPGAHLLLLSNSDLPTPRQVLTLLANLRLLRPDQKVSAIHPSYDMEMPGESFVHGLEFNLETKNWQKRHFSLEFHQGAANYPSWSFAPAPHCLLLTPVGTETLCRAIGEAFPGETSNSWIGERLWGAGQVVICDPSSSIKLLEVEPPETNLGLMSRRSILAEQHSNLLKIIFVLPVTTLSGGIRVVFEIATGLSKRGIICEIWSLNSEIVWDFENVTIHQFKTYKALQTALSLETCIKVATWWETADVVLLSSVNRGMPVQFVQEFETWFYPEDYSARAAVVSSYRPEFRYLTTASFQRQELKEIGIESTLIPVGYDSETYKQIPTVIRKQNTILALGRTFFQKNFKLTADAWKLLPQDTYNLTLFGNEPSVLQGPNIQYHSFPDNDAVNILLNEATVFVQTSIHEGFSLPILEAMAAGCPVITTDSHGNLDFCIDGYNCLMIDQGDPNQLAHKIQLLLSDPVLQERLRVNGLATAKKYQWSKLLDDYFRYFTELNENGTK